MMISLDMMVALPMAAAAAALLFIGISGSGRYLSASSGQQAMLLGLYARSQSLASVLAESNLTYGAAEEISASLSADGINAGLRSVSDISVCVPWKNVCRFVTVSGSEYLLVVSYENTSES